jgi:hypothetical protein
MHFCTLNAALPVKELRVTMDQLDVRASTKNAVVPLTDIPLSDEELCRLALAADPHAPLSDEAIPLSIHLAQFAGAPLPGWYMAPATARGGRRWRTPIVVAIISAFLLIEALGLCNTFGQLSFA